MFTLLLAVASLLAQTVRPHEILLLDNASTDGSLEIARRFPAVRVIALTQNTGFARGNNLAIAAASAESEWIALLNPDAFAAPRWLTVLAAVTAAVIIALNAKLVWDYVNP